MPERHFIIFIEQEQQNASEAKEAARQLDASHEKRVASLEARLAEFSERIGTYDRLRQQDLATVSKLKVRNSIEPVFHSISLFYQIFCFPCLGAAKLDAE